LLRKIFGSKLTDDQAELISKNRSNKNVRNQLLNKTWSGKFWNKRNEHATSFAIHTDKLVSLANIDNALQGIAGPQERQALESLLSRGKNITTTEQIVTRWNELFKTIRINPIGTRFTPGSFFEHWKLQPNELGKVLAKVKNVDDIPKIMAFIQDAHKA